MQHFIICESVDITMFMHVFNCSKTKEICHRTVGKRFKDVKI